MARRPPKPFPGSSASRTATHNAAPSAERCLGARETPRSAIIATRSRTRVCTGGTSGARGRWSSRLQNGALETSSGSNPACSPRLAIDNVMLWAVQTPTYCPHQYRDANPLRLAELFTGSCSVLRTHHDRCRREMVNVKKRLANVTVAAPKAKAAPLHRFQPRGR
jgi:hypothetical protein